MIIVLGANGQLGQSLKAEGLQATYLSRQDCDLTNPLDIKKIFDLKPSIIINATAYTKVDLAEDEVDLCMRVNFHAVQELTELCQKNQTKLIHISTDYVFDGCQNTPYREKDVTSPLGVYGKSKRQGEEAIEALNIDAVIIRTSWLYSEFGHNFVKTMHKLVQEKENLRVVYDQVGAPTYARDLAQAIIKLKDQIIGFELYHFSNLGVTSWFDLTQKINDLLKSKCKITPILSYEYATKAKRPHYSIFDTSKIRAKSITIPHWEESLKTCLKRII